LMEAWAAHCDHGAGDGEVVAIRRPMQ
jgi:hypothetical protein